MTKRSTKVGHQLMLPLDEFLDGARKERRNGMTQVGDAIPASVRRVIEKALGRSAPVEGLGGEKRTGLDAGDGQASPRNEMPMGKTTASAHECCPLVVVVFPMGIEDAPAHQACSGSETWIEF